MLEDRQRIVAIDGVAPRDGFALRHAFERTTTLFGERVPLSRLAACRTHVYGEEVIAHPRGACPVTDGDLETSPDGYGETLELDLGGPLAIGSVVVHLDTPDTVRLSLSEDCVDAVEVDRTEELELSIFDVSPPRSARCVVIDVAATWMIHEVSVWPPS